MTREEAKRLALSEVQKNIEKYGEEAVFNRAPKVGKNSWTWGELRDAILADKYLEETHDNPIDMLLKYEEWKNKRK